MSIEQNPFLSEEVLKKLKDGIEYLYFFPMYKCILDGKYPLYFKNPDGTDGQSTSPLNIMKFDTLPSEEELIQYIDSFIDLFRNYQKIVDSNNEELIVTQLYDYGIIAIKKIIDRLDEDTKKEELESLKNNDELLEYKLWEIENLIQKNHFKDQGNTFSIFGNFASIVIYLKKNYPTKFGLKFSKYFITDIYKEKEKLIKIIEEHIKHEKGNTKKKGINPLALKFEEHKADKWELKELSASDFGLILFAMDKLGLVNPNLTKVDVGYLGGIIIKKDHTNVRNMFNKIKRDQYFGSYSGKDKKIKKIKSYLEKIILELDKL